MTKNVSVIDENGIITGATYPKRAAGLVKKGRARWINDTTICLCAAEKEKRQMNLYEVFDNQISKMQEQLRDEDAEKAMPVRLQILKTLENLRAQEQNDKILSMVKDMQESLINEQPSPENASAREATRQKILELMAGIINHQNTEEVKPD